MSLLAVLLILIISAAILVSIASINKSKSTITLLAKEKAATKMLEEKFNTTKKELSLLKEELAKKSKFLNEFREQSKKKLKKEAIKASNELETTAIKEESFEIDRLKSALEAMRTQLSTLQSQSDKAIHQASIEAKAEFDKQLASYKEEISKLNEQLGRRKKETEKQKNALLQAMPILDVTAISNEAAYEIARLLKKVDNYEKMHGISQGKLQMSQERFAEMQKRYFAVCRELALAVGSDSETSDEQARHIAEDIVTASDKSLLDHVNVIKPPEEITH